MSCLFSCADPPTAYIYTLSLHDALPIFFALTGLGEQAALLQSIGIGVTNLLFTFVGLWLIDRLGRRTLLLIDRKSTRLNSSHGYISYAVFCLKKKIFVDPIYKRIDAGSW